MILKALIRVIVTAAAILLIAQMVPGIAIAGLGTAVVVALVWGLITLVVRPVLGLLTLPINLLTFGLFSFVLNALLFWLVGGLVPGFTVAGFLPALEGSVILMVLSWILNALF